MCPGMDIVTTGSCLVGARGREKEEYNVNQSKSELQVFIFYPSDWEDDSLTLLSSFSSLHDQFLASKCCLYGCSTDSVAAHLNWIKAEFGSSLAFPLLSDMTGQLADSFSLFDKEERINMRGVVITDSKGKELEVINTSLESEELAVFALNIVKQSCQTPAEAVREGGRMSQVDRRTGGNKEPHVPSTNSRSGFRSLDHIWSQVVDKDNEVPVVESKRPKPARMWGQTVGQNKDQSVFMNDKPQKPKSVKIWTPPTAQPADQQHNEDQKPCAKPTKTWGAPPTASCPGCGQAVYPVDQVFAADRSKFHKTCIECQAKGCQNKLTVRGLHRVGGLRLCGRCYIMMDREQKVFPPMSKRVETIEEARQREAKEMKEKEMNEKAMMELKAVIGGGAKPSQPRST